MTFFVVIIIDCLIIMILEIKDTVLEKEKTTTQNKF